MSTRRQLAGLTLGTAAALSLGAPAVAQPAPLTLTARRTELTLPAVPTLGLPYVCLLDLFGETARQVGTATAGSMVVGATVDGPVVLASVVLQLADGEVHYQRLMNRFGAFPRTAVGVIVGGTGAYHGVGGEVDISWPDEERVDLVVRLA
jgi:hypothetical protein